MFQPQGTMHRYCHDNETLCKELSMLGLETGPLIMQLCKFCGNLCLLEFVVISFTRVQG